MQINLDQIAPAVGVDNTFDVYVSTTVEDSKHRPLPGVNVDFLVGGESPSSQTTDSNGGASDVIRITTTANQISIGARVQTPGGVQQARRMVQLPRFTRCANDLEIVSEGNNRGKYTVNATIVDQLGKGVKGTVRVISARGSKDHFTEDNGTVKFSLHVRMRYEELEFVVLGTAVNKRLRLRGPRKVNPTYRPFTDEEAHEHAEANLYGVLRAFIGGWKDRRRQ